MSVKSWVIVALVAANIAMALMLVSGLQPSQAADQDRYPLLSKRLFTEDQNDIFVNLSPLRTQVRTYLEAMGKPHSFYMEYLPSGTSIRIGEAQELVGASLMKLPIVMDLYKAKETKGLSLDQKVSITDEVVSKKFGLLWQAGVGAQVTLREAAKLALTESDNTAARLVQMETDKVLSPQERSLNFLDVDIQSSSIDGQPVIMISARSYSSFLKCLYLACYDGYDDSQEILTLLTETGFHSRIESGIQDESVKVAHKIGSFSDRVSSDCGIIYAAKRPYLFCLMINSTEPEVEAHFAKVSEMAYKYITGAKAGSF